MRFGKFPFILFLFISHFIFGCSKETRSKDCTLNKSIGLYTGNGYDTAYYSYTNGKVSEIILSKIGQKFYPTYKGDLLIGIDFANSLQPTPQRMISFKYHNSGLMEEASTNSQNYYFIYEGDNLVKITSANLEWRYALTNNNFTKVEIYEDGRLKNIHTYGFDDKPNFYQKLFGEYPFIEPLFKNFNPTNLPYLLNKNNVIGADYVNGTPNFNLTYKYDNKGNIKEYHWGNSLNTSYYYSCD